MKKKSYQLSKSSTRPFKSSNLWATGRNSKIYTIYDVLEDIAWLWRILGIFPIIIIENSTNIKRYGFSKFYAFCSLLVFAICTIHFIYVVAEFHSKYSNLPPMTWITLYMRQTASLMSLIFTNVWRVIRFDELSKSINDLREQEIFMEKLIGRFDNESRRKTIRTYVWITFSTIVLAGAFDVLSYYMTYDVFSMEWILWMIPLAVQWMDITLLVSLVGSLGFSLRAINDKIRTVVTRANASSPKVIVTSDVCAENLRVLSKAHFNICAIGKRINRIFYCEMIINVAITFIVVSTMLYNIFYEIQREDETNMLIICTLFNWEFIYSAPIIIVVLICNWTSSQAIYASELIHEIRVEKIDSRLYDAIKSFSLQLHHQKLEFTAGGFFPLDSSLLQTMIGTITTNLVILIQFQPKLD